MKRPLPCYATPLYRHRPTEAIKKNPRISVAFGRNRGVSWQPGGSCGRRNHRHAPPDRTPGQRVSDRRHHGRRHRRLPNSALAEGVPTRARRDGDRVEQDPDHRRRRGDHLGDRPLSPSHPRLRRPRVLSGSPADLEARHPLHLGAARRLLVPLPVRPAAPLESWLYEGHLRNTSLLDPDGAEEGAAARGADAAIRCSATPTPITSTTSASSTTCRSAPRRLASTISTTRSSTRGSPRTARTSRRSSRRTARRSRTTCTSTARASARCCSSRSFARRS